MTKYQLRLILTALEVQETAAREDGDVDLAEDYAEVAQLLKEKFDGEPGL